MRIPLTWSEWEQNQVNGDLITTTAISSLTPSMMSGLILISMMVNLGGQGHKFKAKYALKDGLSLGATYFLTEREDETEVNTLQIDLATKF